MFERDCAPERGLASMGPCFAYINENQLRGPSGALCLSSELTVLAMA